MRTPPSDFSNIINDVKPGFDFTNWEKSPEWAIFSAGKKMSAQIIAYYAGCVESSAKGHIDFVKENL